MNKFGTVDLPSGLSNFTADPGVAFGKLIQFGLRALIVGAGIYALFNLVLAGYSFISAGDDSKKVAGAWSQITQTIIGLAFAAGAFVIIGIISQLLFGYSDFLLRPTIPTP